MKILVFMFECPISYNKQNINIFLFISLINIETLKLMFDSPISNKKENKTFLV